MTPDELPATEGCDDARCFQCDPYGTADCDDSSFPPCAEEVPA